MGEQTLEGDPDELMHEIIFRRRRSDRKESQGLVVSGTVFAPLFSGRRGLGLRGLRTKQMSCR